MKKRLERLWQRCGDAVRFLLWGLTVALVCFLLYRVIVNNNTPHLVPLSEGGRDSLMTVGTSRAYTITSVPATSETRGIIIQNGQKSNRP